MAPVRAGEAKLANSQAGEHVLSESYSRHLGLMTEAWVM
jgi:hypothetical protein